jgi:signal recognition particle GTPase
LLTPSLGVGGKTSLGKLCNVYKNNQILVFFTHY